MEQNKNPYDFILESESPKKASLLPPAKGRNKIVMIVGFLAGISLVIVIAFVALSSIGKANNSDLISTQSYQIELSRVIDLGLKDTANPDLRNRYSTLQATLATDQASLADLLSKRSEKVTKLQLGSKEDPERDTALETAKQNGTFDEKFSEIVAGISSSYYKQLKASLADANTEKKNIEYGDM